VYTRDCVRRPPRIRSRRAAFKPDIDPHLEEIVLHAIERSPRDRYGERAGFASRTFAIRPRVEPKGRAAAAASAEPRVANGCGAALCTDFSSPSLVGVFVLFDLARQTVYPAAADRGPPVLIEGQVK